MDTKSQHYRWYEGRTYQKVGLESYRKEMNYPDYQARVFRRDSDIRWTRPLHEHIIGCKTFAHLPPHEELSLYHPKTIQKQEQQNLYYNQNFSKELNVRR